MLGGEGGGRAPDLRVPGGRREDAGDREDAGVRFAGCRTPARRWARAVARRTSAMGPTPRRRRCCGLFVIEADSEEGRCGSHDASSGDAGGAVRVGGGGGTAGVLSGVSARPSEPPDELIGSG